MRSCGPKTIIFLECTKKLCTENVAQKRVEKEIVKKEERAEMMRGMRQKKDADSERM